MAVDKWHLRGFELYRDTAVGWVGLCRFDVMTGPDFYSACGTASSASRFLLVALLKSYLAARRAAKRPRKDRSCPTTSPS